MSKAVSSTSWSRRGGLLGAAGLLLAGCGFRPLYGPGGSVAGVPEDIRAELAAVRVGYMPERAGVLVRRALERRFESAAGGVPVAAKYQLQVQLTYGTEILGYRRDGGISRVRYIATANWVLLDRAPVPEELGRGSHRSIDAYNVPDYQFFSAEISRDTMERRLLDEMTDQIFLGVAAKLRERLSAPPA